MQAERDLMLACLRDAPLPTLSDEAWERLPTLAAQHGMAPLLVERLRGVAPDLVFAALRADALTAVKHDLSVREELRWTGEVLDAVDVSWVVVKGPVLASHWFPAGQVRAYVDLDLLVLPAHFGRAVEALETAGAMLRDRNWTLALEQQRGELGLVLPHGTSCDLHWHLLNEPRVRASIELPTAPLLDRAITVPLALGDAPTLEAADTLVHLGLHAMLAGGRKLLWYRDLQQVLAAPDLDLEDVVQRGRRTGAPLLLAHALQRARDWAGAAVPDPVLRRLVMDGRGWHHGVRLLDRVRPATGGADGRLSGRLIVQSSRDGTRSSLIELSDRVRQDLLQPLLHNRQHPWRHLEAPAAAVPVHHTPLMDDPSSSADRDRYLDFVAGAS